MDIVISDLTIQIQQKKIYNQLYDYAVQLIKQGDAFVCSETADEIKRKRK